MGIKYRDPQGQVWVIPPESEKEAIAKGYTPVLKGENMPGTAFEAGAQRALSLGFTDTVTDNQQAKAGLRAMRGTAAGIAGEIVGNAPSMLIGGPALKVGGSVLKMAGRAAFEGAIMSAVQPAVTEAALENKPWTIESAAAHTAGGALIGGAFGGVVGKTSQLISKGADKILDPALVAAAEQRIATEGRAAVLKTLVRDGMDLTKFKRTERWPDFVETGDKWGVWASTNLEEVTEAARAGHSMLLDARPQFFDSMDAAIPLIKEAVVDPQGNIIGSKVAQEFIDSPEFKAVLKKGTAEQVAHWRAVANELTDTVSRGPSVSWDAIYRTGTEKGFGGLAGAPDMPRGIQDVVSDILKSRMGQGTRDAFENFNKEVSVLRDIHEAATKASGIHAERAQQAATASLSGSMFFGARSALRFAATAFGKNVIAEGGPALMVARQMGKLGTSKVLSRGADILRKSGTFAAALSDPGLVAARGLLERGGAEGAAEFLDAHIENATGPKAIEYAAALGLPSGDVAGVGRKLDTLEQLEKVAMDSGAGLEAGVKSFLTGKRGGSKPPPVDFDAAVKNIRDIIRNPAKIYDSLPEDMRQHAPEVSGGTTAKVLEAAKFLEAKIPKNPLGEGAPASVRVPFKPSVAEKARFARYVEAVADPASALRSMSRGEFVREHVEVMKALYPETYARVGQAMMVALEKLETPLDYRRRLAIVNSFGAAAVGGQDAAGAVIQMAHAKARAEKKESAPNPDGRGMVNTSRNLETQGDRMAKR